MARRHRPGGVKAGLPPQQFQCVNRNAAGIDVGAEQHYVAVPPGRDPAAQDVRTFGGFTADLYALAAWLTACGVETVAMESTGVYWIPLFEVLSARGFEVKLVNPRQLKHVPGRKTDVLDCQWLQQLHSFGLLTGAFRPDDAGCVLRAYLRQRAMLVTCAAEHIQHMQKALEQMNVKLPEVISDVTGVTGMRIIRAILGGERDAVVLARLRNARCAADEATIARALEGTWRDEHLFALRQALELFEVYQTKIADCDRAIETALQGFDDKSGGTALPPPPRTTKHRNDPTFDARDYLHRLTGVDLTRIDGLHAHSALKIVGEIGVDMTPWPNEKAFARWATLAPGTHITGGKAYRSRTKIAASRIAAILRVSAQSLHHSQSALGAYYRRLRGRIGAPKAITATAHKLACLIYSMLKFGTEYVDRGQHYYEQRYQQRLVQHLTRRAKQLGYQLVKNDAPSPAVA
jgi:transposase